MDRWFNAVMLKLLSSADEEEGDGDDDTVKCGSHRCVTSLVVITFLWFAPFPGVVVGGGGGSRSRGTGDVQGGGGEDDDDGEDEDDADDPLTMTGRRLEVVLLHFL